MNIKNFAWKLFASCVVYALCQTASAQQICWSVNTPVITIPTQNLSLAADAMVPGTILSSTALGTSSGTLGSTGQSGCNSENFNLTLIPQGTVVPNIIYQDGTNAYTVYATNIPEIGYTIGADSNSSGKWTPLNTSSQEMGGFGAYQQIYLKYKVTLVTTGQRLRSGTFSVRISNPVRLELRSQKTGSLIFGGTYLLNSIAGSVTMAARTCQITNPDIQVALPPVLNQSFTAVGAAAPQAAMPFAVNMNCDKNILIYATMTDATNPQNTGNTLSLASGSSATGVGIQIYRNAGATPVSFGPDSSAQGNVNQWYVGAGPAAGGTMALNFTANYVKTASTVTVGTVVARSTITLSYQ